MVILSRATSIAAVVAPAPLCRLPVTLTWGILEAYVAPGPRARRADPFTVPKGGVTVRPQAGTSGVPAAGPA